MSKTQCSKFIDIDSTYRNREQYPNPGNFIVKSTSTNMCGEINGITAEDPVLNSYPLHIFDGDVISCEGHFTGGVPNKPILDGVEGVNYRGALLYDSVILQSCYIESYDLITKVAYLGLEGFSDTFQSSDGYYIYDPSTASHIFYAGGSPLDNAYVGYFLYDVTINETRPIVEYDGSISTIVVDPPFSNAWQIDDRYEIRKEPNVYMRTITYEITQNTIRIDNPPSSTDLFGKFVRITQLGSPLYNQVVRIKHYDPLTSIATVTPGFLSPSLILPTTYPIETPTTYEVLFFSYDNSYFINMTSNCRLDRGMYEIELRSIILPNVTVLTGYGGRLVSYPYIYIEFGNLYGSVNNILISNNPHSQKALFKVPIYDIQTKSNSNFLKIDRTNMPQLIHFNPYEDYQFKVVMPNGEPYIIKPDTMSPLPPNPDLQISVTFKVTKIN